MEQPRIKFDVLWSMDAVDGKEGESRVGKLPARPSCHVHGIALATLKTGRHDVAGDSQDSAGRAKGDEKISLQDIRTLLTSVGKVDGWGAADKVGGLGLGVGTPHGDMVMLGGVNEPLKGEVMVLIGELGFATAARHGVVVMSDSRVC